jgi:DNA-binding NarL/FixJ family response regulator
LEPSSIRVLVVDDYEPWRHFVCWTLEIRPEWKVIAQASDGQEAIQKTAKLHPDLILLDLGLPNLNGIEVARQIRKLSPTSSILFLSEQRSVEIAEEALRIGAGGYVVKSDAASDLIPAVEAVLQGKSFVSSSLAGSNLLRAARYHKAGFYLDEHQFLDDLTLYIGTALKSGNSAFVVAAESHRDDLLPKLQAFGLDMDAVTDQGRYIALDASVVVSSFMLDGKPDREKFLKAFDDVIPTLERAAMGKQPRVAFFGEGTHLLWTQGNVEAAISVERFCNHLIKRYDMDILCPFLLEHVPGGMDDRTYRRICAEHSAVYSR